MLFNLLKFVHIFDCIYIFAILVFLGTKPSYSFSEVLSCHCGVFTFFKLIFSNDSSILRDSDSGVNVVSSAHDHLDSSVFAKLNGWDNCFSQWVLNTENSDGCQILLENFFLAFFLKSAVVSLKLQVLIHGQISVAN